MKSIGEFLTDSEYWEYVHTQATISVMCVLVSKPHWEDAKEPAKRASDIADAVVNVLKRRK